MPLCSRCTGILIGYFLALFLLVAGYQVDPIFTALFVFPLMVDGFFQAWGKWLSNNPRRLITGVMAGIAIVHFLFWCAQLGFSHGLSVGKYLFN